MTAARRAFGKISWVMLTFIPTGALISPTFGGGQEPKEQPTARPRNLEVVSISYTQPPKETETKAEYIPPAADVEALAKMLYGEARGVASDTEKAACVWVVLNRVDDPRYPDTVLEVLESPAQFAGYNPNNPVTEELKTLAADVLTRHYAEETGAADVGRVIPREYLFFTGDGKQNHFTKEWKSAETWGWTLESPYDTERAVQ